MDKLKLERLYKEKGLLDFKLKTEEDLFYIHGIKVDQIEGYCKLDMAEKRIFDKFIINLLNAYGIEYRSITPIKVYVAVEKTYVIETDAIKECVIRRIVTNHKTREIESIWTFDRFKDEKGKLSYVEKYMRFEYVKDGVKSWLHVNKNGGWY